MPTDTADLVVVGGGIIGLATARAALLRHPGLTVAVVEKERAPGRHQSGRNSGVLHAGVYYRPGSLKATLCAAGRAAMEVFCDEHGVARRRTGKVVVAVEADELDRLGELEARATANGLAVERIGSAGLLEREPAACGVDALWVPETGVVDFGGVVTALADEVRRLGVLRLGTHVSRVDTAGGDAAVVHLADGGRIPAARVVVCAGLHGDRIARRSGLRPDVRIVPFRGEYRTVTGPVARRVRGLVYPVPDPELPFLGVHVTRGVDDVVHAGPGAVLALAREGYRWRDVDPAQVARAVTDPATWRMGRRWWRTGVDEAVRSVSPRNFAAAVARLLPGVTARDLTRAPAGVRAQAVRSDGSLCDDFELVTEGPATFVLNAPSPAATASLALADELVVRAGLSS